MSFRLGVKFGAVKRLIKSLEGIDERAQRKALKRDAKHAAEELLDYLLAESPQSLAAYVKAVDNWLSLEAQMVGFKFQPYQIGEGENLFKKVSIERAIFYKENSF